MPRHTTIWEDSEIAHVLCDGQDAGPLVANDPPEACPVCGRMIRLVWDVRIEEVNSPADDTLAAHGREHAGETFQACGRVHDWRNYVSSDVRAIWSRLSDEARGAIYVMAAEQASNEVWD